MSKPAALTDKEIAEIEDRIIRGWVVRRDQWSSLIAMAKERNAMVEEKKATAPTAAMGLAGYSFSTMTPFEIDVIDFLTTRLETSCEEYDKAIAAALLALCGND